MNHTFVNNNVIYTEDVLEQFKEEWQGVVEKAVLPILKDPHWATQILDDLLTEFVGDELHIDFSRNPEGFVFRVARRRAINIYNRVLIKQPMMSLDGDVENPWRVLDEDARTPDEQACWEARGRLMDHAFEQLVGYFKKNGRVRNPRKSARVLRAYLEGDKSCKELATEFQLKDPNYPSVLKKRYLGVLRDFMNDAA